MKAWNHLQPIIDRIAPLAFERGLQALSPKERTVLLVWSYPLAVNDGGHASFFYNSYGEHAEDTVKALNAVGSPEYAQILSRAIELFPDRHIPRDLEQRNDALDALPDSAGEAMQALDAEFYALGDDELITRLLKFWEGRAA